MAESVRTAAGAAALIPGCIGAGRSAETCTVIMAARGHHADHSATTLFRTESCQRT